MPTYTYKGRDTTGKPIGGVMEASSKEELVNKLRGMGYMTTNITETRAGAEKISIFDKLKKPNTETMVIFYTQLSNMLTAGIPLLTVLVSLDKQIVNRRLKEAVGSVSRSVKAGSSFSEALSKHTDIFPRLFVSMVKAGEASGTLDVLIARYAGYFENQMDLHAKIKGALFYPMILVAAGTAVTLFVVTFIIPQFVEIFNKSGLTLPMPTLILYNVGMGIKHFWYLGILAAIAIWFGLKLYTKTKSGRLNVDRFKLSMPIFGELLSKTAFSRFTRTLGTLLASGVPILEVLDITKDVVDNEVLSRVITDVHNSVEKGAKISEPLKLSGEVPSDVVQMISVGEDSGDLEGMLGKIADFYDMSIGYSIKKLTTILEPLFLVIMGGVVGFIMASMLLPMFDMVKVLQ